MNKNKNKMSNNFRSVPDLKNDAIPKVPVLRCLATRLGYSIQEAQLPQRNSASAAHMEGG